MLVDSFPRGDFLNPQLYRHDLFLNGQQWDGGVAWSSGEGLYFNRARYYQSGLGRFIGEDPWLGRSSSPETLHKFNYVSGDPIRFVDPSGMFASIVLGSSISVGIRPSEGVKITVGKWMMMRIAAIVGTTVAVLTIPSDSSIDYETVYRFGDIFNPASWIPNMYLALARGVGGEIWGETITSVDIAKAKMMKAMLQNAGNITLGDMLDSWGVTAQVKV